METVELIKQMDMIGNDLIDEKVVGLVERMVKVSQ